MSCHEIYWTLEMSLPCLGPTPGPKDPRTDTYRQGCWKLHLWMDQEGILGIPSALDQRA